MIVLDLFLQYGFLQRALLAALLVGVLSGVLGIYLVLRGLALLGDGLAHVSFAGVALGLIAGVFPLHLALLFAVAAGLGIQVLRDHGVAQSDVAIGIVFTAGLAAGVLLVSWDRGFNVDVLSFLFGSLLATTWGDVQLIAGMVALLLALLGLLHKEFFYVTFDEEAARLSGLPVGALNALFMALTAATIVLSARIVGILLVSGLVIVPAAASLQSAKSFTGAIARSVAVALAAVVFGLVVSVQAGLASGATIAVAAVVLFLAAAALRVARGEPAPV